MIFVDWIILRGADCVKNCDNIDEKGLHDTLRL